MRIDGVIAQVRKQQVPVGIFAVQALKRFRDSVFGCVGDKCGLADIAAGTGEAADELQRNARLL